MNAVDLFSAFAVDTSKEVSGTPLQLPGCGDTKFLIARAGNKAYGKLLQSLYSKNASVLKSKGDDAEAKAEEIQITLLVKTILVGWEGTVTYQGKALTYSEANARTLLAHKDFREVVMTEASSLENFKVVKDEEDAGN